MVLQYPEETMKWFQMVFLVLFTVLVFLPAKSCLASPAQDQLQGTISKVIEILRNPAFKGDASIKQRRENLRKVIYERFSFEKMSQLCLGKHWKDRSDAEKKEFIELFGKLLEETYISKIEGYTNEKVEYLKEVVNDKKIQINTRIVTEKVEIPIDYRLYQEKDGSWMVYDLVIEGVSLVNNYRSQFDEILQKDHFQKLLAELKKKIDS
jgi:phospholipid transport system substrate-binding protein